MNFLKDIVLFTPDSWTKDFVYEGKKYILVDLEENTEEYKQIANDFRNKQNCGGKNLTIQRVQHLSAFARYKWHKDNCHYYKEQVVYVKIREQCLSRYLDTNCDSRISSHLLGSNIFVQKITLDSYEFGIRNSSWYPQYVIKTDDTADYERFRLLCQQIFKVEL